MLRRLNIVAEVTGFGDREFYKARALHPAVVHVA